MARAWVPNMHDGGLVFTQKSWNIMKKLGYEFDIGTGKLISIDGVKYDSSHPAWDPPSWSHTYQNAVADAQSASTSNMNPLNGRSSKKSNINPLIFAAVFFIVLQTF